MKIDTEKRIIEVEKEMDELNTQLSSLGKKHTEIRILIDRTQEKISDLNFELSRLELRAYVEGEGEIL